jgi:tryptophan 2,3-dioxygenase
MTTVLGKKLANWLCHADPAEFPYEDVVNEYLRVGKHFVCDDVLKALACVRDQLDHLPAGGSRESQLLRRFLGTALDKWDGRYDYTTYIALGVLDLPSVDNPRASATVALTAHDRLVLQLIADALGFELAAADGRTTMLPELRPDTRTVTKRHRLSMHAATPALVRLGLDHEVTATEPVHAARQLYALVDRTLTEPERAVLRLSLLPVYVVHDEYLFIRVLQLFETTFAMMAVQLQEAVREIQRGDCAAAASGLALATLVLRESAPLFSLLATMQVESFRRFRVYTEGASAIQSRNYKIVESLCRRPDRDRLASMAYQSVPEVRDRVLRGQPTLDQAFTDALASGRLSAAGRDALTTAMHELADALLRWRQTHYRLAVRMLGERPGTGYTEGTPYLKAVRPIPVFLATAGTVESGGDEPA